MIGLIEAIVDGAAEILQTVSNELEALSTEILTPNWSGSPADCGSSCKAWVETAILRHGFARACTASRGSGICA